MIRAQIDWGVPKGSEKIPAAAIPLNPTIRTRHMAMITWLKSTMGDSFDASSMDQSMAQLSYLEILPVCGDSSGRMMAPVIIAMRSHLPHSISHYSQEVFTTIDRWEIREKAQTIHPAFEQVSSRRNSTGSAPGVSLIPYIVLSVLTDAASGLHQKPGKHYSKQDCHCTAAHQSWQNHVFSLPRWHCRIPRSNILRPIFY